MKYNFLNFFWYTIFFTLIILGEKIHASESITIGHESKNLILAVCYDAEKTQIHHYLFSSEIYSRLSSKEKIDPCKLSTEALSEAVQFTSQKYRKTCIYDFTAPLMCAEVPEYLDREQVCLRSIIHVKRYSWSVKGNETNLRFDLIDTDELHLDKLDINKIPQEHHIATFKGKLPSWSNRPKPKEHRQTWGY